MKAIALLIALLLGIIAYKIPSPIEIGRGILEAEDERRAQIEKVRAEVDARIEKRDAEESRRAQAQQTEQEKREEQARQLAYTRAHPTPYPVLPIVPRQTPSGVDILRKYGPQK